MALLKLIIFTLTLLVGGGSAERFEDFYHAGQDAILPCKGPSSSGPQDCSRVSWVFNRKPSRTFTEVRGGNIMSELGRGDRLTLNPDCSLVLRSIKAEDAGLYTCQQNRDTRNDVDMYLSILTVRVDPAVYDQSTDSEVQLECTLFRYKGLQSCEHNGLRWVDDSGTELKEGVQKSSRGADCLSGLTVKLQSGSSRRVTCQFVNGANELVIEAGYTPGFKDPRLALTPVPEPDPAPDPKSSPDLIFIIVGVLLGVLLLLGVSSAVLIKHRRGRAKVTDDVQAPPQPPDEPESDVTYITVSHIQHQEQQKKKRTVKEEEGEEEVTYSAVRSGVWTETDDDPSSLYSTVSRPE